MRAFISRCRALGRDMSLEFLDGSCHASAVIPALTAAEYLSNALRQPYGL